MEPCHQTEILIPGQFVGLPEFQTNLARFAQTTVSHDLNYTIDQYPGHLSDCDIGVERVNFS
jgi:hypothetical protein